MNHPTLPFSFALLSCIPNTLTAAAISQDACPPSTLSVRLPPYLDPALNATNTPSACPGSASYPAPSLSFYTGTWYLTNASLPAYRNLSNLQWDLRPVIPSCKHNTTSACPPGTLEGCLADLSTWALDPDHANATNPYNFGALGGGRRPVASFFGHDTPRRLRSPHLGPAWDGVFDIYVSGHAQDDFTEMWSVLYWGLDRNGVPLMLVHETDPPSLDVFTQNSRGPEHGSLAEVMDALIGLGNDAVTGYVKDLGPVKWDYELAEGAAICGERCMENK